MDHATLRPFLERPRCVALLLCNGFQMNPSTGYYSVSDVILGLGVAQVPITGPNLKFVADFQEGRGNGEVGWAIVARDSEDELKSGREDLECGDSPLESRVVEVNTGPIRVPDHGWYDVVLWTSAGVLAQRAFRVWTPESRAALIR